GERLSMKNRRPRTLTHLCPSPLSLSLSPGGRGEGGSKRHNLGCQASRLMAYQMQSNCPVGSLWTRIGAECSSVRPVHKAGPIDAHMTLREIIDYGTRALLSIEGQYIWGQRPIVQHHSVDVTPQIGGEHCQVLLCCIPIRLTWLGDEIAHIHT